MKEAVFWPAMVRNETETVKKNAWRRTACFKKYSPSRCSNRRPQCGNNHKGCRLGNRHDRGNPTSCLEPEKSGYNGSGW